MVEQINYEAGAAFLARLNFYLSLALETRNAKKIFEVQEKLSHDVLSPVRLQEIVKIFGNRRLYENYVLLNRAQLLVGIKLLAIYGRQEGGNCLETEADRATIGELALAINSFYGPGLGEPNWPLKDVIVQLAATAELYNSETFVNGLVRTRCLLGPILRDSTAGLKGRNLPPPFEPIFTLLNGLNFRDFLDITLYLWAGQSQMLTETMEADAMAYADVTAPKRYVSGKSLKAWAELMAVDLDDLRSLVHGSERDPAFFFDFTIFRRFPLWRSGLAQPQLQLVGRPCRESTIKIISLARSVIWMNERTPLTRLPPLLKAKAKVIKCDAVDIETLAIGSVYGNKLRRKVQDLAELRFLLPNRFFPGFALSDVHRYAPELDELSRCAENRMA